ncbi:MAG: tagaturonate epimerase family protein, partial [Lentisphaeria bacterium]|nr:tagaturonate epimerase family protein [Lentisphaeria bacterium]
MDITPETLGQALRETGATVYPASALQAEDCVLALARQGRKRTLVLTGAPGTPAWTRFEGTVHALDALTVKSCALNHANAVALRQLLPWTAPVSLRQRRTTLGCGDRLGRATPGHLRAVRRFDVAPVLAQQSIRELTLTGRTYENVVDDVTFLVLQEGYRDGYGADGDHLKTLADIDMAVDAGMAMITLDLSERMNAAAETWSAAEVEAGFAELPEGVRRRVSDCYAGRHFDVASQGVTIEPLEARRCAVMYNGALDFAREAYDLLCRRRGEAFDLEISIDETSAPTLPSHHLFIIRELLFRDIVVSSLAPRFIGEFQKAVDYIGDLAEFEQQFAVHCAIAQAYGDYKVSIHSGSDKFSVYPAIGRHTRHRVHVKTAGTSWLEAVRAIAAANPKLYRRMHTRAFEVLPEALKLYHITPHLERIPDLDTVPDDGLPALMDHDDARQLLHVTYGGLLRDEAIRDDFFEVLDTREEVYHDCLERHFVKHLTALG